MWQSKESKASSTASVKRIPTDEAQVSQWIGRPTSDRIPSIPSRQVGSGHGESSVGIERKRGMDRGPRDA